MGRKYSRAVYKPKMSNKGSIFVSVSCRSCWDLLHSGWKCTSVLALMQRELTTAPLYLHFIESTPSCLSKRGHNGSKALLTASWPLPQRSSLCWVMSSVTWDLRRDNSSSMWEHACHVLVLLATPCAITYTHKYSHHTAHVLWDQSLTLALPKHEVVKF